MEYHTPDNRWVPNFEEYSSKVVVKGEFHRCVPKDIVEDFVTAEYIMAHAFYHYPLYDEALSKVLRLIEMSVKLKCKELVIPFDYTDKKGKAKKKKLFQLMDELVKAEPSKNLRQRFAMARNLRNSLMHPERLSYAGAMGKNAIKNAVSIINTLFLPESVFMQADLELNRVQKYISSFKEKLLVFELSGKRFLVSDVSIEAAIETETGWYYLLIGIPVMLNAQTNLKDHNYNTPLSGAVSQLTILDERIEAADEHDYGKIKIYPTNHPADLLSYQAFLQALSDTDDINKAMYEHYTKYEISQLKTDFWYQYTQFAKYELSQDVKSI